MIKVGVEITLPNEDSFLLIRETLTRIGISSARDKKLYQTAHILHKQGRFFIVHFKEMFILDRRETSLNNDDIRRRNAIVKLLQDWKLLDVINFQSIQDNIAPISEIKILKHTEKDDWELVQKYTMGKEKKKYWDEQR